MRLSNASERDGKRHAIIAKTVKGKGVSFMENNPGFHGKAPNADELKLALGGDRLDVLVTKVATRQAFGETLLELGRSNPDIVVIGGDLNKSTMATMFGAEFPGQVLRLRGGGSRT